MGRKADEFKASEELRLQQKKPKKPAKGRRGAATARPGVPNQTSHNASQRAQKKARYELELSASARPPRKSTRISSNRQKPDSQLRMKATNRIAQASERRPKTGKHRV
jgi:hypothetical protein